MSNKLQERPKEINMATWNMLTSLQAQMKEQQLRNANTVIELKEYIVTDKKYGGGKKTK